MNVSALKEDEMRGLAGVFVEYRASEIFKNDLLYNKVHTRGRWSFGIYGDLNVPAIWSIDVLPLLCFFGFEQEYKVFYNRGTLKQTFPE